MSKTTIFEYRGKAQTVTWDRRLCIHVGECGRSKGDLFVTGRDPWCAPDLSDQNDVQDVVARCPTGALAAQDADGTHITESVAGENEVLVANDGPLYLSGALSIDGASADMHSVSRRAALVGAARQRISHSATILTKA